MGPRKWMAYRENRVDQDGWKVDHLLPVRPVREADDDVVIASTMTGRLGSYVYGMQFGSQRCMANVDRTP